MAPLSRQKPAARIAVGIAVAIVSIAAWFLPAALGAPSSLDLLVIACWLVAMGLLLIDSRRRERRRQKFMRTFYVDLKGRRAFSPLSGVLRFDEGCDLLDSIVVALSNGCSAAPCAPPDDFVPSLVIETSSFSCARDSRLPASATIRRADDVTVTRWEGVLSDLRTGAERSFASPFDLEDTFCPKSVTGIDSREASYWNGGYACASR